MATAIALENEISCSVCCEIYQDPHVLRECLHTFCLKCVKRIEHGGRVRCPECREFTNINDIKKDFKTQRLIDLHQTQQKEGSTGSHPSTHFCGMCKNSNQPITLFCVECDIFLCSVCETVHKETKSLKSHTVKSIKATIRQFEIERYKTISDLKKEVKYIDRELKNISTNMADIKQSNTRQLDDMNTFTDDRIQAMKDQKKTLKKLIIDANDNLLQHLKMRRETFIKQKKDIQSKIDLLENLVKSQDLGTLQETADSVKQTIQDDISKVKSILSQNSGYMPSYVTVQQGENWNVEGSIDVKVSDMMYNNQETECALKSMYAELHTHQYELNTQVNLNYHPSELCLINNQIWCVSDGGLYVYDKDCQLVKKVNHVKSANGLALCDTGHVILACRENNGLHLMDTSLNYHGLIIEGNFCDVACYNTDIYALDHKEYNIIVLRKVNKSDKWNEVTRYKLEHIYTDVYDKLCVNRAGIHVSSFNNSRIYVYNTNGQLIHKIGKQGDRPGELWCPHICDVDPIGNTLIADYGNSRIQVCDRRGDWHLITLPTEVTSPIHAVVGYAGELWIIHINPYALIKCTVI